MDLPYPLYLDMVQFYGNPEEYLKPHVTKEEKKALIDEAMKHDAEMLEQLEKNKKKD